MNTGRPAEAVQQADLGLQEDPLNLLLRINRAVYLAAAGRDEDAVEGYREILELNPSMVLAQFDPGRLPCVAGRVGPGAGTLRKGVRPRASASPE